MNKLTVSIEKFHPLTVVYPDVDVIPAGTKLFIQLPPIKLYWGAAMPGLIDQQVTSEYPLYGYTMDFERATPLSEIAAFIVSGEMPKLLEETWRLANEQHKEPLGKEAPRAMALVALARSMGHAI